jgi:hypothetical protein
MPGSIWSRCAEPRTHERTLEYVKRSFPAVIALLVTTVPVRDMPACLDARPPIEIDQVQA